MSVADSRARHCPPLLHFSAFHVIPDQALLRLFLSTADDGNARLRANRHRR